MGPAGVPEGQSLSDTIFEAVCEEYAWTDRVIRLDESPPAHFSQPFLAGQKERQAQYLEHDSTFTFIHFIRHFGLYSSRPELHGEPALRIGPLGAQASRAIRGPPAPPPM